MSITIYREQAANVIFIEDANGVQDVTAEPNSYYIIEER